MQEFLPRIDRRYLLGKLGLELLDPADGPLTLLRPAARAVMALTTLRKPTRETRAVQVAAVALAGDRLKTSALAELLQTTPRTIQRLRSREADGRVKHALRLQLALHAAVEEGKAAGPFAA